jgi:acyl-CoA dehydrogenase
MDFELSEEQQSIVDTVRRFVTHELYPHEDEVERLGDVPPPLVEEIRTKALKAGIYAANMPEELGGGGLDSVAMTLVERELGKASYALQWLVARPSNILRACEGEQRERYLLPTIRGERHDCLAMTEPGAGSDVRSMTCRARREGDEYVIDGTKHFISHADLADFVILFAATGSEDTARGPKKLITGFLVDLDTPGLTVTRGSVSVSHRGYHHCELSFENCRVPVTSRLGDEGRGFDLMAEWLGASRLTVAASSVGRARRVLDMATRWAAERVQFGQPIGRFQGVGFPLADLATELAAAELLTLRAAWKLDQGSMTDADAAMAKLFASEALGRITDEAVQIFGGMGLMTELPIERFWRDARVERIWDGTSEIQRHIIARSMLRPLEACMTVRAEPDGQTLVITLDRPKANAIDVATSLELYEAFDRLQGDDALRVAVVTGAGDRFFCAGWDLKAAAAGEPVDADHGPGGFAGLTELTGLRKPVIAAVNGLALGGGFELALAADLMVVAEHAELALPEVTLGIVADSGGVLRLPRRLPHAVATEMLLTGRRMGAAEAHRWGLANRVVAPGELLDEALSLARSVSAGAPLAIAAVKEITEATAALSIDDGYRLLRSGTLPSYGAMLVSADATEGPRAFVEKRPPRWQGR